MACKIVEAGAVAPEFVLRDQFDQDVALRDYRGKYVVLAFHPLAWTPVCADQMRTLDRHRGLFDKFGAVCFGVSVDPGPTKKAWREHLGLKSLRLLSDFWPHGAVSQAYGILREEGFSERALVVVDPEGTVIYSRIFPLGESPSLKSLAFFLKDITGSDVDPNVEISQCLVDAQGGMVCMPDSRNAGLEDLRPGEMGG